MEFTSMESCSTLKTGGAMRREYLPEVFEHELLTKGREKEDSEEHWRHCEKNPGHPKFIPLNDFRIHHMPPGLQDARILKFIIATAGLTAKVKVDEVSPHRLEEALEVCYQDETMSRFGTGFIYDIRPRVGLCPCQCCAGRPCEDRLSWRIMVRSAQHVVYDDFEVKSTTITLFEDIESFPDIRAKSGDDSQGEKHNVKFAEGFEMGCTDEAIDSCSFSCITHDELLVKEIENRLENWKELRMNLRRLQWQNGDDYVAIVSHPHGKHKHVTVGRLVDLRQYRNQYHEYVYEADTCRGCSGASVWRLGRDGEDIGWPLYGLHHSKRNLWSAKQNVGYF